MPTYQAGLLASTIQVELKHTGDKRLVTEQQLPYLVNWASSAPELVLDYEGNGLKPWKGARSFMAGFYAPDKGAKVLDIRLVPNGKQAIQDILKARRGLTIAHNATHECMHSQVTFGCEIGGSLWDNQAASFAVQELREGDESGSSGHAQKTLVHKELKRDTPFAKAIESWLLTHVGDKDSGWDKVPLELLVPYNCEDVGDCWDLYKHLRPQVERGGYLDLVRTDSELCRSLADIALEGIAIDVEVAKALADRFQKEMVEIYARVKNVLGRGVDLSSHQALFGLLYGDFGIPMHADLEKEGKLDHVVLEWMLSLPEVQSDARKSTVIQGVLDWRERDKLVGTYLLPWIWEHQVNGVIHPNLNQFGARTRRFSSSDPNLQNVPIRSALGAELRRCFVARSGMTNYSADYSQVEYRGFTHYCGEPVLVRGYLQDPSFDIHAQVSLMLSVIRKFGKNLNFGILYGMGKDKLARSLQRSKAEAEALLEQYYARLPGIKKFRQKCIDQVKRHGYVRDEVFGGTRHLTASESFKGLNSLCQMTAANLMRKAMVATRAIIRRVGGMQLLQIHDEQKFQLPGAYNDNRETVREVIHVMETCAKFRVPMKVDAEYYDTNWGELKEVA